MKHLKRHGYTILDRNVHLGRYEVDILAREGDTIVFAEVKTRRTDDVADPEDNVTPDKQRRLITAAKIYMAQNPDDETYYRFDVVAVLIPETGKPTITLYKDAFRPS